MVKDILRFDTTNTESLEKFLTRYNNWVLQKSRTNALKKTKAKSEPGGIPCFHWRSIGDISNCKDSTIAIDALGEGLPALLEIKDSLDADKFYIFFTSGTFDPNDFPMPFRYTKVEHHIFRFDFREWYLVSDHPYSSIYNSQYQFDKPRKKLFSCVMGRKLPFRDMLASQIKDQLQDSEYVLKYDGEISTDYDGRNLDSILDKTVIEGARGTEAYGKMHEHMLERTSNSKDRDRLTLPLTWLAAAAYIPINLYNQSHFWLTVESTIDVDGKKDTFLTEKSLRPLATGTPFVLVSTPGFLESLRKFGFKTYDNLWDESYDLEHDPVARIDKILALIKSLRTFDWQKHQVDLRAIADENIRNFTYCNSELEKEFNQFENIVESLWNRC